MNTKISIIAFLDVKPVNRQCNIIAVQKLVLAGRGRRSRAREGGMGPRSALRAAASVGAGGRSLPGRGR